MLKTETKKDEFLLSCGKRELVDKILVLEDEVEKLNEENKALKERAEKLESLLKRNSKNSSSPPSLDKKKRKKNPNPKPKGAPKGHKGGTKLDFGVPDNVSMVELPDLCPDCESCLKDAEIINTHVQAVAELVETPIEVTEYIYREVKCPGCNKEIKAKIPENVLPNEQYGPRLQGWLFLQKGYSHQSNKKLVESCNVFGVEISQGTLNNQLKKLNKALKSPVEELRDWNKEQDFVHMDETGWSKCCSSKKWMWTVSTKLTSYLEARKTRGTVEIKALVGEDYDGVIVSDRAKCYEPYKKRQLCWAHLKRDIQVCIESKLDSDNKFGNRMMKYVSEIFHPLDKGFPVKKKMKMFLENEWNHPPKKTKAKTLRKALLKSWDNLWRFEDSDIPPDNNEAERSLRLSVTHRKVCGASRTEWGAEAISKLFTVIQTCNKQGKDKLEFISKSLLAYAHNKSYPSLVPK